MTDRDHIQLLVKKINEAWVQGRPNDLNQYFHPDMVIVGPNLQPFCTGIEACVRSYQKLVTQARIQEYRESSAIVEVWASTAVATYFWEIAYSMFDKTARKTGHDLFVFHCDANSWKAVYRAVLSDPLKS